MKKMEETEEKLSMTRELKFKELQEKIDEEEADRVVEEAIQKTRRKNSKKSATSELEKEIDDLLMEETKKSKKIKTLNKEELDEELSNLLDENVSPKSNRKKSKKEIVEDKDEEVKVTKVNTEDDLYLTSSFKPLKKRMKFSKVLKFIFKIIFSVALIGSFIYFVLFPIYKMIEDSKPKAIFSNTLDYVQEQVNSFLDNNLKINEDKYSMEFVLGFDSDNKKVSEFVDSSFVFYYGTDSNSEILEKGYFVEKDGIKHGYKEIEENGKKYLHMTTSDYIFEDGEMDGYKRNNSLTGSTGSVITKDDKNYVNTIEKILNKTIKAEDLIANRIVSTEDYKYYVNAIVKALKQTIDTDDLVANREELEIDGFTINVVRNSLEFDKKKMVQFEKDIKNILLKDEKFLNIEAAIKECTVEEIRKSYNEVQEYDDKFNLAINLYTTKGNKFVGFDIEKDGFRDYYFYKYENKFEAHANLSNKKECLNGECDSESRKVLHLVGTTKNDITKVDVFLNDEDLGSLEITSFNFDKVDLKYNLLIDDIKYEGNLSLCFQKDEKEYDLSVSMEIDGNYLGINLKLKFDALNDIGSFDESKVIQYDDKTYNKEFNKLLDELEKDDMIDSFELFMNRISEIKNNK